MNGVGNSNYKKVFRPLLLAPSCESPADRVKLLRGQMMPQPVLFGARTGPKSQRRLTRNIRNSASQHQSLLGRCETNIRYSVSREEAGGELDRIFAVVIVVVIRKGRQLFISVVTVGRRSRETLHHVCLKIFEED